jgi:hypothetical protein
MAARISSSSPSRGAVGVVQGAYELVDDEVTFAAIGRG